MLAGAGTLRAQFGFGAGIAAIGDNIRQAGGEVADLVQKDSITYQDVSNGLGFYFTGRVKYGLGGPLRIIGDASYIFYPASQVTLVDANFNGQEASATFDVGSTLIPINLGLEVTLPIAVVRPYLGAEFTYTFVSRTYTIAKGDPNNSDFGADIANKPAKENEAGVAFGAGAELAVGPVALDLGGRFNLTNLFTKGTDEKSVSFLQLGATLYFGDLLHKSDKSEGGK
jgi:hypothetical protein